MTRGLVAALACSVLLAACGGGGGGSGAGGVPSGSAPHATPTPTPTPAATSFAALHTYYLSPSGSDSNNGTSAAHAGRIAAHGARRVMLSCAAT